MGLTLEHLPADVLGLSALSRAVLADRPRPQALGGLPVPARLEHFDPATACADSTFLERSELVERFHSWRAHEGLDAPLHPAQARSLERLSDSRSQVVVCGQQPGFLGGPLLNLYKALHTVRLAAALEQQWSRPVVPLFWCHSDDHDLAEMGHAHVLNPHLDIARIGLPGMGSGRRSIGTLALDREAHRLPALLEHLRQLLPPGEGREPLLEAFFPRHGETLATAFVRGWDHVLGHTGLLIIEPAALREPLSRALAHLVSGDLDGNLRMGLRRLADHVGSADLDPERVPWVFEQADDGRRALRWSNGAYRYDGEVGGRTGFELAARIVDQPGRWSAGVLTRPLVQDLCLPVAAYVGGWGELGYHAPLAEIRTASASPLTPFCHRLAATLVDPTLGNALRSVGLSLAEALAARGQLSNPDSEEDAPPVIHKLRSVNSQKSAALNELRTPLAELDRGLANQLRRAARQSEELVEKIARKAERAAANRTGRSNRHLRRVNNSLFGRDLPQERLLTIVQAGAALGLEWIDELLPDIEPLPSEHLGVYFPSTDVEGF
ncbi:bacillithiol biosynthesis protein BshC [Engelhardtia mirabilis]|uniref:Cysteine ligase BshC n=1 Tax=Engelhardtia mirabilis TaxID=2528011 RepID=A0A518BT26_9BACT|nr:hypothetical protein Pla133_52470 [Planctomycetes bacterium Pla133]QDV04449.1 hypothetical protein Pla86_52440 [Planctomycetes bacterium Pla86]